jgi:hypothetical protein
MILHLLYAPRFRLIARRNFALTNAGKPRRGIHKTKLNDLFDGILCAPTKAILSSWKPSPLYHLVPFHLFIWLQ